MLGYLEVTEQNMDAGVRWRLEAAPMLVLVVQLCGTVDSRAMSGMNQGRIPGRGARAVNRS